MLEETRIELEAKFLNSEKLFKEIDDLVWLEDITYLDATIKILDQKHIDIEAVQKLKLVAPILYSKLYEEAVEGGYLKNEASLPWQL